MSQASQLEKFFEEKKAAGLVAVSEGELLDRYVAKLNELCDDANDRGMLSVFVEAAAWKLAVVAFRCGPVAAGDVFYQVGRHLKHVAQQAEAQREAERARADGRQPN